MFAIILSCWALEYIDNYHLFHIHFGKTRILFSLLFRRLWWGQIVGYVLACRSHSFLWTLHHLIIINLQTYLKTLNLKNACQIYFVECVIRLSILFQFSLYNIWGCVFSVYPFPLWWLREYILCLIIINKSGVWLIIHCLGLSHETIVCVVCVSLSIFINEMKDPFYKCGVVLIPALISNYIRYKLWDEISYPSININGAAVQFEIGNFTHTLLDMWLLIHTGIKVFPSD